MQGILITTVILTVIGIIVGAGLVFTSKKFYVEVDEKEAAVRAVLPGNNCGACGYAGCDALAAAISKGEAPANACPVGGASVAEKVGDIMGVAAEASERKVAFVYCKGSSAVTRNQGTYIGIQDCRAAVYAGMNLSSCNFGCIGLGSCEAVCPENAIHIKDGLAEVNTSRCIGRGLCVKACPKDLIGLKPEKQKVMVQCCNRDRGPQVKAVCSAGCIGCRLCEKQCEFDAIHVVDNIARIDFDKCTQCGKCAEKCPAKVINF